MTNKRDSPRLRFSKEELANPKLARKAEKAEQAAERYDHARKKLQTHRLKLTAQEVQQEQKILRQEYLDSVRRNLRSQLNQIDIEEKDGSITNLGAKYGTKKGH